MNRETHKRIAGLIKARHEKKDLQDLLKIYFDCDNQAGELITDIYKLSGRSHGVFVLLERLNELHEMMINLAMQLTQYEYKDVYEIYAEFDDAESDKN